MGQGPTPSLSDRLTIVPGEWYGWTMWPGYGDCPYHSPIEALGVRPQGNGSRRFDLEFFNAGYAHGVQSMEYPLRTLVRERTYILASVEHTDRAVAIVPLSLQWLHSHLPDAYAGLSDMINQRGYSLVEAVRQYSRG